MGRVKKRQLSKISNHHDNIQRARKSVSRRQHSQNASKVQRTKLCSQRQPIERIEKAVHGSPQTRIKIPFIKQDRVLLVGEGDFSFALSLTEHHGLTSLVATCYDDDATLEKKYPHVVKTIAKLSGNSTTPFLGDASLCDGPDMRDHEETWRGFSSPSSDRGSAEIDATGLQKSRRKVTILYGIDATKLSSSHKKHIKPHCPFTKIVFNFPHVGGLSTDVNRQVRANQQLLVGFFNAAKPLLATESAPARPITILEKEEEDEDPCDPDYESHIDNTDTEYLKHGRILVTLFEGEPYTLWNIRDLARHSGLKVLESFKFPWLAYPGYQHARTVGDITSGKDRSEEGKRQGAWRGEERDARCYVLALKDDDDGRPAPGSKKRKQKESNDDCD